MATMQINLRGKLNESVDSMKTTAADWLKQGLSPRRLALTLALGFAIGCIPMVGIPTVVCAGIAILLGLNQPAIQAANYAAIPLQILLVMPLTRFGGWLIPSRATARPAFDAAAMLHVAPMQMLSAMGSMAGQALLAWLVLAVPAVCLLTFAFTIILRKVPVIAAAEAGD